MDGLQERSGTDIIIRDKIIGAATEVFKNHGGVRMDTPYVVSRKEDPKVSLTLMASLEPHTTRRLLDPIIRWLERNPEVKSAKRYMIGDVCNFSIVGAFDNMLPDAEILRALTEILSIIEIEDYKIRVNHRKIIDGILESCTGFVTHTDTTAIENLILPLRLKKEFQSDDDLRMEMERLLRSQGYIHELEARNLSQYLSRKGGRHLQYDLLLEEDLTANGTFSSGLHEMGLLFDYLEAFGVMDRIEFDLSFTHSAPSGLAFMVVAPAPIPEPLLGASKITEIAENFDRIICLATGGRGDSKRKDGTQLVYFSIYVDEVFGIIKEKLSSQEGIRESETELYVMSFGEGLLKERMQICKKLWDAGIKAEFSYQNKPELSYQMKTARESGIPFAVIISKEHLQQKKVKIVDLSLREGHPQKTGIDANLLDLVSEIKQRLERKRGGKDNDEKDDTDSEDDEEKDSGTASGGDGFNENVKKVTIEGGTVDMEGIEIEMDFAKITSKGTQIEVEGAKIKMKNAKIELRGRKEE